MMQVGRLCVKLAGRDARKKCLIVEILDNKFVLIDGETRRRKCNILHLEPLDKVIKIKNKATTQEVAEAWQKELGTELKATKKKESKERPKKSKAKKDKPEKKTQKKDQKAKEKKEDKPKKPVKKAPVKKKQPELKKEE